MAHSLRMLTVTVSINAMLQWRCEQVLSRHAAACVCAHQRGRLSFRLLSCYEDEYSYVLEGTIGGRVGDHEVVAGQLRGRARHGAEARGAVREELKAKGAEFTIEPKTIRPGVRIAFVALVG
jgi:hypothetical protein